MFNPECISRDLSWRRTLDQGRIDYERKLLRERQLVAYMPELLSKKSKICCATFVKVKVI
jgi:hypothetical protein